MQMLTHQMERAVVMGGADNTNGSW